MQVLASSRAGVHVALLRASSTQPQQQRVRVVAAVARRSAPLTPLASQMRSNAFGTSARPTPRSRAAAVSVVAAVAAAASSNNVPLVTRDEGPISEEAFSVRRLAWASFWTQLSLSIVSAVVLFFTAAQSRPTWAAAQNSMVPFPFLCTAAGVAGSFVSTALAFGLTRVTRAVIVRGEAVKRSAVVAGALAATRLNLVSTGAALVGLQATVGSLVSSTLLTATQNPFAVAQNAAARGAASAPVALDVFAVQASANVLVSHFASIVFATWLIRLLARAPPSKGPPQRRRRRDDADDYEFALPPGEAPAAKTAFEAAQDFKKGNY